MLSLKPLARAAGKLHAVWLARCNPAGPDFWCALERLKEAERALHQARSRFEKARARGLSLILAGLRADLRAGVRAVQEAPGLVRDPLERPTPAAPSLETPGAELRQVEAEVGGLEVDF